MKLQFTEQSKYGTLSYKINDGNEFIVFNNVLREKGLQYRLAIVMFYRDSTLKISD